MIINLSNPFIATVYKYFFDMTEKYTRKKLAAVLFCSTIAITCLFGFGVNWDALTELQTSTQQNIMNISQTQEISHEQAVNHLAQDEQAMEDFNNAVEHIMPSSIWLCLIMLLTIPAIIKRANDCVFSRSSSYPVAIYYVVYSLQVITGSQLQMLNIFNIFEALALYSFFYVFIVALLPTHEDEKEQA